MIEFKGSHFERDVILWAVRWYVAYPISYRQLEEMMEEHGVEVDHATLNRWVLKYVLLLERAFRARKQPASLSWRMDETYVRVKGAWKYLYRAVDKAGATVDFLPTANRDRKAALRFLRKAIKGNGTPEKVTIDKSGANTAGACQKSCVRGRFHLIPLLDAESIAEHDGELRHSSGPFALSILPIVAHTAQDQIQQFGHSLVGWEVSAAANRGAECAVEALDCIGGV